MTELSPSHPMLNPRVTLRWVFIGRLSLAAAIFLAAALRWDNAAASDTLVAALATVSAAAFTAASAWYAWFGRSGDGAARVLGRTFLTMQSLFDLALVTAVVHLTGRAASQFAALYILVLACAALFLPVRGGLLVAALGCAVYAADALLGYGAPLTLGLALQIVVFVIVALCTAFLGARLRDAGAGREELEAQLVLARLQADDILRNIRSGIITVDAHGRLLYVNPAAGTLLGVDPGTVLGRPVDAVLGPVAPQLAAALGRTVRERVRIIRGEARITLGRRTFPIGLTTTTIDSRDPGRVSATAIFQDISESKRLEDLRVRAERLEGVAELSASLAHEIKNPLAAVRSAVEQLARAPHAGDDERVLGALIVRESDRLSRLLSEFIDFARVRATRDEPVDIAELVRAAARLAGTHPDRREGAEVTCVAPSEPVIVRGDEDLLHRAVFNLALNAVQAAPAAVRLEVYLVPPDDAPAGAAFERGAVAVRVTDDGPGIPDAVRGRVFDPFFTTKPGGTGLGLPMVHRAIDAHRGLVLLKSSDRGTQFTVLLPAGPPPTPAFTTVIDQKELVCSP